MTKRFFKRRTVENNVLDDFLKFSQIQYNCLDYDPFHPMIQHFTKNMSDEKGLWLSTLYMAYYNMGSAYIAFKNTPVLTDLSKDMEKLPIGVQRRNLRAPGLMGKYFHLFNKQVKHFGSIRTLLTHNFTDDLEKNWLTLMDNLNSVWGNGRWSSYTLGELYHKANNIPVIPCDIMNDGSSGPRAGLQYVMGEVPFTDKKDVLIKLDAKADELFDIMKGKIKTKIPYLSKNHLDHAMMESELCDFNSLRKGRYYVGRDVDRMQERINKADSVCKELGIDRKPIKKLWKAREELFDHRYLGELNGWDGRTKYANHFYKKHGKIADHKQIRKYLGIK